MKATDQFLTIQQVSQKCDVPKSTLRFWEQKFGNHISPVRSKGGQRRYSAEQVAVIALIKRLKAEGLSLEAIGERIASGVAADPLSKDPSLERLADRIAAMVKHEVCRFLDGEPQAYPPGRFPTG